MVDEPQAQVPGWACRQEQAGIGHQAMVVKEDADTVGFVLWRHLLGAPCFRAGFCSKTIIPDSEEHPLASSRAVPKDVLRWIRAKVERHQGELFPRVGFIVTNLSYPPKGIVRFYNGRGTAEQWIKEGKYALNWTRLSCHKFVANQVRLWLFVLTYNLGNFMRRLVLPEDMKHWTLTSLQTRLIKTGGRLVRHARRLVFQLAEVLVTREMLTGILERISRLRLAPG